MAKATKCRSPYQRYDDAPRVEMPKYVGMHGLSAAFRHFAAELRRIVLYTTVQSIRCPYHEKLKVVSNQAKIVSLTHDHGGRPFFVWKIKNLLLKKVTSLTWLKKRCFTGVLIVSQNTVSVALTEGRMVVFDSHGHNESWWLCSHKVLTLQNWLPTFYVFSTVFVSLFWSYNQRLMQSMTRNCAFCNWKIKFAFCNWKIKICFWTKVHQKCP